MRTTYMAKPADIEKKWYVVDATDKTLGRLASEIAKVLVINADKIKVTGKKMDQKIYRRNSGWIGGLKETPLKRMLETKPEDVLIHAVKGMLPKNALGRAMMRKLFVYASAEHPHAAQKPEVLEIKY